MVIEGGLESYRATSIRSVFYVPDYLKPEEERLLMHKVYGAPATAWKEVKGRRLQNLGGLVHAKGLLPSPLPEWLRDLTKRLQHDVALFPKDINHVLVNEYHPGQGIMAHQDGPAYAPVVCIISLGLPAVVEFSPTRSYLDSLEETRGEDTHDRAEPQTLELAPRSLLVFSESAYQAQKQYSIAVDPDATCGLPSAVEM